MKRDIKDYYKTVDILIKAFFKGTLNPNEFSACACGNIAAVYKGYKVKKIDNLFVEGHVWVKWYRWKTDTFRHDWLDKRIPYSEEEMRMIEKRFMSPYDYGYDVKGYNPYRDEFIFAGLCAVVDYLGGLYGVERAVDDFKNKCEILNK